MDYKKFLDDYASYDEWNNINEKTHAAQSIDMWGNIGNDSIFLGDTPKDDRVHSPSHYTSGKREVIDTIEDAVKDAPSTIFGMLQGQVLKYLLRVWLKDNPLEDLKKARWYLDRLIGHLEDYPGDNPAPRSRFT